MNRIAKIVTAVSLAVTVPVIALGGARTGFKQLKTPDDARGFAMAAGSTNTGKGSANLANPMPVLPQFNGMIRSPDDYGGLALPFRNDSYDLTTVYLGTFGTDYLNLYAGALQSDSSTGVLVVRDQNPGGGDPQLPSGVFTLPVVGYLTMTAVSGTVVNMTDGLGLPHVFDLVSDRYLS